MRIEEEEEEEEISFHYYSNSKRFPMHSVSTDFQANDGQMSRFIYMYDKLSERLKCHNHYKILEFDRNISREVTSDRATQ